MVKNWNELCVFLKGKKAERIVRLIFFPPPAPLWYIPQEPLKYDYCETKKKKRSALALGASKHVRPLPRGPATCFNMAQGYSVRSRPESFPRYLYPMAPCSWHTYLDSGCWTSVVEEGTVTTFSACDGFTVCFWWMRIYFRFTDAMQDSSWNPMISNKLAVCNDPRLCSPSLERYVGPDKLFDLILDTDNIASKHWPCMGEYRMGDRKCHRINLAHIHCKLNDTVN